jgi:REP element-mobilizing transposase RayT
MPGTYTQLYVQIIFAVKNRNALIKKDWQERLFSYIAAIIDSKGHKSIIVNGVADHVHILVSLNPSASISDLVRDLKNNSSKFVNENKLSPFKFNWQEGYGAFSYSRSQLNTVYNYILNQEEHHRKKTFKEEYIEFLKAFEIEYSEKYLFDWFKN